MPEFFRNLQVGVETPHAHGFNVYFLREDGAVLVQNPISLVWVIYAQSIERAIEKYNSWN